MTAKELSLKIYTHKTQVATQTQTQNPTMATQTLNPIMATQNLEQMQLQLQHPHGLITCLALS